MLSGALTHTSFEAGSTLIVISGSTDIVISTESGLLQKLGSFKSNQILWVPVLKDFTGSKFLSTGPEFDPSSNFHINEFVLKVDAGNAVVDVFLNLNTGLLQLPSLAAVAERSA
jgi:hypothetical protein